MRQRTLKIILGLALLVTLAGCSEGDVPIGVTSAEAAGGTAPPAVEIHRVPASGATGVDTLELAAWPDGRVIWQDDGILLQGSTSAFAIREFLRAMADRDVFTDASIGRDYFTAGKPYVSIDIRSGGDRVRLASSHEQFAGNGTLTATAEGSTPLQGRTHDQVLRAQPLTYQNFRTVWTLVREQTAGWRSAGASRVDRAEIPPLGRDG